MTASQVSIGGNKKKKGKKVDLRSRLLVLLERILDASLRELCTSWRFCALGVAPSRLNFAGLTSVEIGGGVGKPGDFA